MSGTNFLGGYGILFEVACLLGVNLVSAVTVYIMHDVLMHPRQREDLRVFKKMI